MDILKVASEYIKGVDGTIIDENANATSRLGKFHGIFQAELIKSIQKLKGYNDIYCCIKKNHDKQTADDIMNSIFSGDMYLHDSCFISIPYCWATSVQVLVHEGIQYNDQLISIPPKKRR